MSQPNREVAASDLDIEAVLNESSLRLEIMSEVRRRWDEGQALDAKAFLEQHPDLGSQKSVVLDLAFEEYCQKSETGELVDTDAFCRQYPTFEKSLRRLIAVQDYLDQNTHLMPKEVDWPQTGQVFHGFHVLAELGRGAFARVFLAQEVALGSRLVAVKVSTDGAGEADILGRLQHPSIVPVYSVQEDAQTGLAFVCMPYLGRATLCDLLDQLFSQKTKPVKAQSILEALRLDAEEFPVADDEALVVDPKLRSGSFVDGAVHLGRQLAAALAYSHSHGVCHSDLKPSNVLISPGGRPMLLDFNLAFRPRSMERRLGGTLPYMAPEQLRALSASPADWPPPVDERSDVFSLGVILHELLSGSLPFGTIQTNLPRSEISADLLERQRLGPASLREANRHVDAPLAELVESCLAFDPADRPQTAEELAAALSRHGSPLRRARRWTRRNALFVGLLAAFLLLFGSALAYQRRAFNPTRVAQEHFWQGQYDQAVKSLDKAIDSGYRGGDVYYWRGRAYQKLGSYEEAAPDYAEAARLDPARKGPWSASAAYCWAMAGKPGYCVHESDNAIAAGCQSAEVYNNLGCAHRLLENYGNAIEALDKAVERNPRLGPALHNRAFTEFRWADHESRPLDLQALTDIDQAIEIEGAKEPSAWLYFDAALVYQAFERQSGESEGPSGKSPEMSVTYLCRALDLGVDRKRVETHFRSLCEHPEVKVRMARSGHITYEQRLGAICVDPFPDGFLGAR